MEIKFKKIIGLAVLIGFISTIVYAQSAPEFLVSWRAINYVPADYQGKILPSNNSPVEVSFDLIDGNKIVNLSKKEINWYFNGRYFNSGIGLKTITFNSNGLDKNIRINISDYNGRSLDKFLTVSNFKPEIVVDAKDINKKSAGKQYNFTALPYFFNVSNLSQLKFQWKVNDQNLTGSVENPESLSLDLKSETILPGTNFNILSSAQNIFNDLEFAAKKLNFTVK